MRLRGVALVRCATVFLLGPLVGETLLGAVYSVQEVPGGANRVNNAGAVLTWNHWIWSAGTGQQVLLGTPYASFAGWAVNDNNSVGGAAVVVSGDSSGQAAMWNSGEVTLLPKLRNGSDLDEEVRGLNNGGDAVGYSAVAHSLRAVRWSAGQAQDLGLYLPRGADESVARAINGNGQVLITTDPEGSVWGGPADSSYLLNGSTITPITAPSSDVTGVFGEALNDTGMVAGTVSFADGSSGAFLWSNGSMVIGRSLFSGKTGKMGAIALNNAGTAVGVFSPLDQSPATAFRWDGVNAPQNLNDLIDPNAGWYLYAALGINESGQIVGNGLLNGVPTGYILTPVPEAASISLMAVGSVLVLWRKR